MKTIEGDNYDHDAVSGLTPHDIDHAPVDFAHGALDFQPSPPFKEPSPGLFSLLQDLDDAKRTTLSIGICGTCGCDVHIRTWNENNGQCWRHADHTKRWTD